MLLLYRKLVPDLEKYGLKTNPYEPCAAKKLVCDHQMMVTWHVKNLAVPHKDCFEIT